MNWLVLAICSMVLSLPATSLSAATRLTLLTYNAEGAGLNHGKPMDETLAVLRAADADLAGLQELRALAPSCWRDLCPPVGPAVAPRLAAAVGMHLHEQRHQAPVTWANAVLSRFPFVAATPNDTGVVIEVDGRRVAVFNIHPDDYPYQPFQLLGIPYYGQPGLDTAEQAVRVAKETRGEALRLLLEDIESAAGTDAQVIFGDFNEPSHLDWTERAAAAGIHPMAVPFPLSRALEALGFADALRAIYPDEVAKPAYTWSAEAQRDDPTVHHDRVDFILVRGRGLSVESVSILGEKAPEADLVVTPWPSDHRAVRAVIRIE
jgi:endonuclease/exonuclease/phosphatase family metal-dependent hydrolase